MNKTIKVISAIIVASGFFAFSYSKSLAVSASCSYVHRQTCCGDGYKTLATGAVTINHNISMQGGTRTNFNVGDVIRFNYSWNGSFTANGGAWDTPTVYKCSTANSCFNQFVGNTRANTYTQRITDSTGKTGYIQWQADKSSNTGIRLTSSNPSVVACAGTTCSVVGSGTATITATTSRVWVRLFSKIFSDASPNGWYASLAPEGYINVPGRGYVLGNSTVSDGNSSTDDCVIRNLKGLYIDPPTSSTGNYKGIRIPSRAQTFNIVVATPKTSPTAVIDTPATTPISYNESDEVSFSGHGELGSGGGSIDRYSWIEVRSGTPSYNGTRCSSEDSVDINGDGNYNSADVLSMNSSFTKNDFSVGMHRICFNVRQTYTDGTSAWAGQAGNIEYRDVVVASLPEVDLKVNGSDGPINNVQSGGNLNMSWTINNAVSCIASNSSGSSNWIGSKSNTGGSESIVANGDNTYTLTCQNSLGTERSDSVLVNMCTPSYVYSCSTNESSLTADCAQPENCGKAFQIKSTCYKSDSNSCIGSSTGVTSLSDCSSDPDCVNRNDEYLTCPACPNEGNWVEVAP